MGNFSIQSTADTIQDNFLQICFSDFVTLTQILVKKN